MHTVVKIDNKVLEIIFIRQVEGFEYRGNRVVLPLFCAPAAGCCHHLPCRSPRMDQTC